MYEALDRIGNFILFISEIFGPTLQGEGALIGKLTIFIRFGGCDDRCIWCDTPYAVHKKYRPLWKKYTACEILEFVQKLYSRPLLLTLSGGNPALYDLTLLIMLGKAQGYEFALETQGTIFRPWFQELHYLTLSPKPPSSRNETPVESIKNIFHEMQGSRGSFPHVIFKFVVADQEDFAYAKNFSRMFPLYPVYLQSCNGLGQAERFDLSASRQQIQDLLALCVQDQWMTPTVLPQLHAWIWEGQRGV